VSLCFALDQSELTLRIALAQTLITRALVFGAKHSELQGSRTHPLAVRKATIILLGLGLLRFRHCQAGEKKLACRADGGRSL